MSQQPFEGPPGPPPAPAPAGPAKKSGLAIASLICGIVFFVPFAPLAALILGIIALAKISSSGGALGGKGMAIAGVVLGGFFMMFNCLILPAMLIPAISRGRQAARMVQSKNNLKQIGLMIVMYRIDYNAMPDSLQTLVDRGYIKSPAVFKHPASERMVGVGNIDLTTDYYYFPLKPDAERELSDLAEDIPILWEKSLRWSADGRVNALYLDGHVEARRPEELEMDVTAYLDHYRDRPSMPSGEGG